MPKPNYTHERMETYKLLRENPNMTSLELQTYFSNAHTEINISTIAGWKSAFNKSLLLEDGTMATMAKEEDLSLFTFQEISTKYQSLKEENKNLKNSLEELQSLTKDYIISISKIIR